jgi:hypothetical protein
MRHESRTTEAVTHVRQVLGPADPTCDRDYTDMAPDHEARATLARIIATRPDEGRRTRTRRRRWSVVAGTVLTVGVVAVSADATGVVPSGVVKGLLKADSPYAVYGRIDAAHAQLLVEARTERGDVVQWWEAPTTKGGWCNYHHIFRVRKNDPHKTERSGEPWGESCGEERTTPGAHEKLNVGYSTWLTYAGLEGRAAKPAVQVRLTLKDGQRLAIPLKANGYFMSVFPRSLATDSDLSKLSPATIVALDAEGRTLAVRHL